MGNLDRQQSLPLNTFLRPLDRLADFLLSASARKAVEHGLVRVSMVLFLLHCILFVMHEAGWLPFRMPESLFGHPLHILYTPFSAILVAEVYLLVFHLPSSFARSMGKQLEIVSLIEIRSVFRDLSALQEGGATQATMPWEDAFFPHIVGAVLLGAALVGFYRILPRRQARLEEVDLARFIRFKRHLAALLCVVLAALAAWSFGHWLTDLVVYAGGGNAHPIDPNSIFYGDFFTALIFVDVVLLVTSLRYLSDYGLILRNSGFVVATIILRLSFSMEGWTAVAHEILAATLALILLLLQMGLGWGSHRFGRETSAPREVQIEAGTKD
jgi:hypothetical protein